MPFPDRYLAASLTPGGVGTILADLRVRALAGSPPPSGGTLLKARPAPAPPSAPLPVVQSGAAVTQNVGHQAMFAQGVLSERTAIFELGHKAGNGGAGIRALNLNDSNFGIFFNGQQLRKSDVENIKIPVNLAPGQTLYAAIYAGGIVLVQNEVQFYFADASDPAYKFGDRTLADVISQILADPDATYATARPNMTAISMGEYAPVYRSLKVNSTSVSTAGEITAEIEYYSNAANAVTIEVATAANGAVIYPSAAMQVVANAEPGFATVVSGRLPKAHRSVPLEVRIGQLGVAVEPQKSRIVWPGPMAFGINIARPGEFYFNQPTSDKCTRGWRYRPRGDGANYGALRGPDDANPELTYDGNPANVPSIAGTRPGVYMGVPTRSGSRMRAEWKGLGTEPALRDIGGKATDIRMGSGGGLTWMEYTHTYDIDDIIRREKRDDTYLWYDVTLSGTGSQFFNDFRAYEINGNGDPVSPTFWDETYVNDCRVYSSFPFPLRSMDAQRGVDNSNVVIDRVSQSGDRSALTGVSIPNLLDLYETIGGEARLNIPLQASDNFIRTEARRMARWARRLARRVGVELANEIWNAGQNAWRRSSELGLARGYTGSQNDIAMRYWSYRHLYVMKLVEAEFIAEGVQHLFVPIICLQSSNPGNNRAVVFGEPGCEEYVKRIEVAPYGGYNAAIEPTSLLLPDGGYDREEYARRVRQSISENNVLAAVHQDFAFSINAEFGMYEGGLEWSGDRFFNIGFRTLPISGDLVRFQLEDAKAKGLSCYRWFDDNNAVWYGIKPFLGASRQQIPGYDAWLDAIEASIAESSQD